MALWQGHRTPGRRTNVAKRKENEAENVFKLKYRLRYTARKTGWCM